MAVLVQLRSCIGNWESHLQFQTKGKAISQYNGRVAGQAGLLFIHRNGPNTVGVIESFVFF